MGEIFKTDLHSGIREMKLRLIRQEQSVTKTTKSMGSPLYGYHHGYDYKMFRFETETGEEIVLHVPEVRWTASFYSSEIEYLDDFRRLKRGEVYDLLVRWIIKKFLWLFPFTEYYAVPRFQMDVANYYEEHAYFKGSTLEQIYESQRKFGKHG